MDKRKITKTKEITAINFSQETIELIKKTVAVDATDNELKLFLYQAKRTGLDPLARQIYFVKRGGRVVIQTSIDGFRVIAQRNKKYAGQGEPEFEEKMVANMTQPTKSKVTVYKFSPKGERYAAAVGVAYWNEYCPPAGQDFMWRKMPHTMLSKVAEALALRKAFPQDLSGIYTDEEMEQSVEQPKQKEAIVEPELTQFQRDEIDRLLIEKGKTKIEFIEFCQKAFKKNPLTLTISQANYMIDRLKALPELQEQTVPAEDAINIDEVDEGIEKAKQQNAAK